MPIDTATLAAIVWVLVLLIPGYLIGAALARTFAPRQVTSMRRALRLPARSRY